MSYDDDIEIILTLPDTMRFREVLVEELTAMASGKAPYENFKDLSPRTRAIWRCAATLLGTPSYAAH